MISSTLVTGLTVTVGAGAASSTTSAVAIVPSPNPTPYAAFAGVACPSINNCFAVGDYSTAVGAYLQTLIEHWNGTTWSIVPSPNATAQPASLDSVSCPNARSCFAVGEEVNASGSVSQTLIERWNGTRWSIVPSPNPTGPPVSSLSSVACPSTTNCFAVGGTRNEAAVVDKTLVEHWNGTRWSIVPQPDYR